MAADILIVEDEALIAYHLQDLVEEAGHKVIALAHDPAQAMAAAARQRPDFAFMDIRLAGGASGVEAARMLYEGWGVRSIFLSANLDSETRARLAACRPLAFIGKPFLPIEATTAIETALLELAAEQRRS